MNMKFSQTLRGPEGLREFINKILLGVRSYVFKLPLLANKQFNASFF